MKLAIKHLAPYLPYKLKVQFGFKRIDKIIEKRTAEVNELDLIWDRCNLNSGGISYNLEYLTDIKPILRPMGEIEEYFDKLYGMLEHQDVTDFFDDGFLDSYNNITIDELYNYEPEYMPYGTFQVLVKHHFDVFGLIPLGLAITKI